MISLLKPIFPYSFPRLNLPTSKIPNTLKTCTSQIHVIYEPGEGIKVFFFEPRSDLLNYRNHKHRCNLDYVEASQIIKPYLSLSLSLSLSLYIYIYIYIDIYLCERDYGCVCCFKKNRSSEGRVSKLTHMVI